MYILSVVAEYWHTRATLAAEGQSLITPAEVPVPYRVPETPPAEHPIPDDVAEMTAGRLCGRCGITAYCAADHLSWCSDRGTATQIWRVATDTATPFGTAQILNPGEPVPDGLSVVYTTTPGPGFTPTDDEARQHAFRFANKHNATAADHWRRRALEAEDPGEHRPYTPEVLA